MLRMAFAGLCMAGMLSLPQTLLTVQAAKTMNMGASVSVGNRAYFAGVEWRVIGYDTDGLGTVTLFSEDCLSNVKFRENGTGNEYAGSNLERYLEEEVYGNFTDAEQAAIEPRTLLGGSGLWNTSSYDDDKIAGSDTSAHLWPLSVKEAYNLGGYLPSNVDYWLRSPGKQSSHVAFAGGAEDGYVWTDGAGVGSSNGARPALYLKLDSIILTSAASGGKTSGTLGVLTAPTDYTGNERKLTLLDPDDTFSASRTDSGNVPAGSDVSISYSNADKDYISAILLNSSGNLLYYGHIAEPTSASGTADITIPSGLSDGSYTLKVFSEDCNSGMQTDIASEFSSMSITVGKKDPAAGDFTVTLPSDTVYDGSPKEATASGASGMGTITLKYYDENGTASTGAPTELGTYTVKLDVTAGTTYAAGTGITKPEWSFTITPQPVAVTGVSVDPASLSLEVGESETLDAKVTPSDASNRNVTWDSDDDDIATVTQGGKVTGISEGSTIIRVTTDDGSYEAECAVTVYKQSVNDDRHDRKSSRKKKESTPSKDYDYKEFNGQFVYGGLVDGVFAPVPANMIPGTAYPKFNSFWAKKIQNAAAGSTLLINADPWTSFNRAFADAFTAKGDIALTVTYTKGDPKDEDQPKVPCHMTIPAGTNLTELLDAQGYIGFAKLEALYGADPVTEEPAEAPAEESKEE